MRTVVLLVVLLLSLPVCADEQQTFFYEYDAAGNIVGVRAVQVSGAPIVDSIQPDFLNRDALVSFSVTGSNLASVTVSSTEPMLAVSAVELLSDTQVRFSLFTIDAPLGAAVLNFTNLLGMDAAQITISERLPIISIVPSPLVLAEGQRRSIVLRIDQPFDADKTVQISVADDSVAQINGSVNGTLQLLLTAGDIELQFDVTAGLEGSTQLLVLQVEDAQSSNINITVIPQVPLADGPYTAYSNAVGVRYPTFVGEERSTFSRAVGVRRNAPAVSAGGSVSSSAVGIRFNTPAVPAGEDIFSRPVGVKVEE